jgi:cysteine protease ATG4
MGGRKFSSVEECMKAHRELIWFTYKKNFKISLRFHSDIGWGCLIRVAQMAMAEALRRFLS